jgi:hypothetical protein
VFSSPFDIFLLNWRQHHAIKQRPLPFQIHVNKRAFFLIRIVGGGVQAGSTRHVGH